MTTLHLLGIFHTVHNDSFSHCAFTGKARRFPKMMRAEGWNVVSYANEGSDEDVTMLSSQEYADLFSSRKREDFYGDTAIIGSPAHQKFETKLMMALQSRVAQHDIICHPFGHVHESVVKAFPQCYHVETGIGYPTVMENTFKIFESYAWMHSHQGRANRNGRNYEWVIPNYFDLADWEPSYEPGKYLAFLGRICEIKGMDTIKAIADHSPYKIVLHGQGDPEPWKHPNIEYRGPINGKERSDFLRGAAAILMPSNFTEPFAGAGVEAMLCGTPLIAVDYGAFTETVVEGVTGFRCHTLQDWVDAIGKAHTLDRKAIAQRARSLYSLEACGKKYTKVFETIADLSGAGWYTLRDVGIRQIEKEDPYHFEKEFWGDCTNTVGEDLKHFVYAKYMKLDVFQDTYFATPGKSVLDIGGGPTSMLLKCAGLREGKVVDPIDYPSWVRERYKHKDIEVLVDCAENITETGWDEVWIYNCLQHTIDPEKIIENAKRAAPILRIFEWIDLPPHDGHPHELTEDKLNSWIGQKGETTELAESGCHGRAYYGCFKFTDDTLRK